MKTIVTPQHVLIHGDSLQDVAAYLRAVPSEWADRRVNASRHTPASGSWDLNVGYDGAWRLANEGWSQGAADLHTAVEAIEPDAATSTLRYGMAGERPDVPRYLGGAPDAMVTRGRERRAKPVVHVIVNASVSCGVSAKAIAAYGAALTAVIDTIENSRRRVELDMVAGVNLSNVRVFVGWNVKRASEHLDLSAVAFSVAHPAAFRRLCLALYERSPARLASMSYGYPIAMGATDKALMDAEDALVLPGIGLSMGGLDAKQMIPLAIKQINAAAGEELVSAS